jgi:hypothetical protein
MVLAGSLLMRIIRIEISVFEHWNVDLNLGRVRLLIHVYLYSAATVETLYGTDFPLIGFYWES